MMGFSKYRVKNSQIKRFLQVKCQVKNKENLIIGFNHNENLLHKRLTNRLYILPFSWSQ